MKEIKIFDNEVYINIGEDRMDYHNLVTRTSTIEQRKKYNVGDTWINGLVCLKCKEFIRSRNAHDFRTCSCGACSVDGGSWGGRYIGNIEDYIPVYEEFFNN